MVKDIEGWSGYTIDHNGVVYSVFKHKRPIYSRINDTGYPTVMLWKNNKAHSKLVHRLLAKAFIPNLENKPYINHIDGIKTNLALNNLEWCTPKENGEHASKNNLVSARYDLHVLANKINGAFIDGYFLSDMAKTLKTNCNTLAATIKRSSKPDYDYQDVIKNVRRKKGYYWSTKHKMYITDLHFNNRSITYRGKAFSSETDIQDYVISIRRNYFLTKKEG